MNPLIRRILYVGTQDLTSQQARSIALSQLISVIAIALFSIVVAFMMYTRGWTTTVMITCGTMVSFFLILGMNLLRFHNGARLLLSVVIPLTIVFTVLLPHWINPSGITFSYVRSPEVYVVLIAGSIIPTMIFALTERKFFMAAFLFNLIVLLSYEPLLYRVSHPDLSAYTVFRFISANLVVLIMHLFLNGSVYFIKSLYEQFESKNQELISKLHDKNRELVNANRDLSDRNHEIQAQNEEIQAQSEELQQSQDSLILATREVERQKLELEAKNKFLEKSLDEKSLDLLHTNRQLVTHNNELQQFSFTVSHNLRGPVASIQGLLNIYNQNASEDEKKKIISLLTNSVHSLETIIRDLGKIIDIRNDKFTTDERIDLQRETGLIIESLASSIERGNVSICTDFEEREIVSVKAYINSILYNLISNAIQYRAPDRKPMITASSRRDGSAVVLEVRDNGLGIDLKKYGHDVFKLYKRFHTHTQGKGLGLFIVRQQVEQLNGKIEVESAPDAGTAFRIYLEPGAVGSGSFINSAK